MSMTKKEAMAFAISTGKPIRHQTFSKDEYVIILPQNEFWSIRSGGIWEDGWQEYKINK